MNRHIYDVSDTIVRYPKIADYKRIKVIKFKDMGILK